MNSIARTFAILSLATPILPFAALAGCKTNQIGVTNTLGTYSILVDAAPEKATKSAEKALKGMNFLQISSSYTKIDGRTTARTAQNDEITVDITQAGDNVSKVCVRVGGTGDAAISRQILDKIKSDLN